MSRPTPRLPRPRRRFGQHFLVDPAIVAGILELVRSDPEEAVVEIGPGRGVLTRPLVKALDRLVAIEIDRDLAGYLRDEIAAPTFRLIEGDALDQDLGVVAREQGAERLLVVGNIPYNITAPLIFRLLEQLSHVGRAILMVQQEVAHRLTAQPGSKDYSLLTVLLAMHGQARIELAVGPRSFRPPPRVHSAVVQIEFSIPCRCQVRDETHFGRLVRTAFGQRRKMLRNSLLSLAAEGGREQIEEIGKLADIDLERRPETLSLEEFARMSDAFVRMGEGEA